MNKALTRKITTIVGKVSNMGGLLLVFCAGMLFVLLADLELNIRSPWLFFSILLALGSTVCLVLANKFKEKAKIMYILKAAGMLLAICFIIYIVIFLDAAYSSKIKANSDEFQLNIFAIEEVFGKKMVNAFYDICTLTIVITVISVVLQIIDVVFTALRLNED